MMQKTVTGQTGYFVDWNGDTRRVEAPGTGLRCEVRLRAVNGTSYRSVEVIDGDDFVMHVATYFETLDAVQAAGVALRLLEETP
jgi:hypothetical protein